MKHDPTLPTPQELRAIRAIAKHGTLRGAAMALLVSVHTVDKYVDHLRDKSGLRYLPQIIAWAARRGWLDGEPAGA